MATKVLNMIGPPGAAGAQGATGTQGPTGNQGPIGATGSTGPAPATAISTDSGNVATLGTDNLLYVPQPVVPPMANAIQNGLLTQVSGLTTDFVNGANSCQDLATATRPVIWSVKTRSINTILNPSFEVDQRNFGAAISNIVAGNYCADGWIMGKSGTMQISVQQTAQTVYAPGTSYQISTAQVYAMVSTAQATLGAGDYVYWWQPVEGIRARALFGGPTSISLIVYSTVAPMSFSVSIRSPDNTRSIVYLCTVPTASVATYITIPNIPVFTGGNFSNLVGVRGYAFGICLGAGSTYTAPAAGAWQNSIFFAAPGTTNFAASAVGSLFYMWFVQHEPGATCTQFMDIPYQDNLRQCQRYFFKTTSYSVRCPTSGNWSGIGQFVPNSTAVRCRVLFPFEMAIAPTIAMFDNTTTANAIYLPGVGSVAIANATANTRELEAVALSASSAYTVPQICLGQFTATAMP
jgi:hypothetical protein